MSRSLDRLRQLGAPGTPLLSAAANGDFDALSELLEAARPVVHGWAEVRVSDPDDAEDVTQLVLLRLLSRLENFRGDANLTSWLYRVTANEATGFFRKRSREREKTLAIGECHHHPTVDCPDDESIDRRRLVRAVWRLADTLPPLQSAAFRLVDLEGLFPAEAAIELGRTQTNVRSGLCRARKKIRRLIRGNGHLPRWPGSWKR